MKKILSVSIFLLILFLVCDFIKEKTTSAPEITKAEILTKFKKNFADVIPEETLLQVAGLKSSPIDGLQEGVILFKSLEGTRQLSFLISNNGEYIIFNPELYNLEGPITNKGLMNQVDLSSSPKYGSSNPNSINIVEYSDFQCPACGYAAREVVTVLKEKYGERITLHFKHFPLSFHKWADDAAYYTSCINTEFGSNNFWKMHDLIFNSQDQIKESTFKEDVIKLASNANLDFPYKECLESYNNEIYKKSVQSDLDEAIRLGINSTPTFVIEGYLVTGADLFKIIEAIEKFSE